MPTVSGRLLCLPAPVTGGRRLSGGVSSIVTLGSVLCQSSPPEYNVITTARDYHENLSLAAVNIFANCQATGTGTWDLGPGTWDLGLGTWDLRPGTWE